MDRVGCGIGPSESDLVYWRGHLAEHSRPITPAEFDRLRRLGLRNLRNFYRSLWGVAALALLGIELYRGVEDAAVYVVLINLGAFGLLLYSIATHLLPALQFLRVPHNATVRTFSDPATFTLLADSPIEVVIPGGVTLRRAGVEMPVPKAAELMYAAAPVAQEVDKLPVESLRDATPGELEELKRRSNDRHIIWFSTTICLIQAGVQIYRSLAEGERVLMVIGILFVLMAILALVLIRPSRQKPPRIRIVREALIGDRKVAWAEYAPGHSQPWTIEGEPADWRKR